MQNQKFEYREITTGDGSPTLSLAPSWEHMHALEGAFTETLYIYQPTVEKAFRAEASPVFLSLGLGLAYNEILIAFESITRDQKPKAILSYESAAPLREAFSDWLTNRPSLLAEVYDQITKRYEEQYSVDGEKVKGLLRELLNEGKLLLLGAVEKETSMPSHAILFDAFSSKSSPELWTEEFLNDFFSKAAAETCFVSTYACNGELKRALRNNGFTLAIQKGFAKKRHSIFAHKGTGEI